MKRIIEKIKNGVKKAVQNTKEAFIGFSILLDESRNINENGDWDEYHARKNRKVNRNA